VIDVAHQVNSVQRRVGSRALEAGEARTVTISRTFDHELADVWDACTNPSRIPRWFLPVSGELRLGGRYQLEGNAGGTIESCSPPTAFSATWEIRGTVSWVEVRLSPESDGTTRFTLEHIALAQDGAHWDEFGPGAVGIGWDLGIIGLTLHLASGAAVDPRAVAEWSASNDGRRFMTLSAARWCDADVAAGTDAGDARARSERTAQFYTGGAPVS
jgi:uncharacterized protein YndB with AHSA1/START domain